MERTLNVTEARNQLPTLVKVVAEQDEQIIIVTRNEPKAIIMGYETFLAQQKLSIKGARYELGELIEQAGILLETTIEECRTAGETKLYAFWQDFGQLMRAAWAMAGKFSEPHALLAFQLFELSERCLLGDTMLSIEQLLPIANVLSRLMQRELTMADAAAADRYLLQNTLDASFPLSINSDISLLYEIVENANAAVNEVED